MNLDKETVQKIAYLARIKLTEEEISRFESQLSEVLSYVEQLNEVKTGLVTSTAQVTGLTNVFQEDSPQKEQQLTPDKALANAPEQKRGYFKLKSVL